MPPDPKVQDILDSAIASVVVTGTSGLLANAGIILGIYFGTIFIATVSRALSQMHGVQEDRHWWSKYIISFFMLFWFGIVIVFSFNAVVFGERLAGIAEVNWQLSFPLQAWIARLNLPLDRRGAGRARACALPFDAGKLSDPSSGAAGCNFLCGRLDHRDETFPALRGAIRSLQPDLSRAGIDHRAAHVDVSHLSAAIARRQIERHHPASTRENAPRSRASRACACDATRLIADDINNRLQPKEAQPLCVLQLF